MCNGVLLDIRCIRRDALIECGVVVALEALNVEVRWSSSSAASKPESSSAASRSSAVLTTSQLSAVSGVVSGSELAKTTMVVPPPARRRLRQRAAHPAGQAPRLAAEGGAEGWVRVGMCVSQLEVCGAGKAGCEQPCAPTG